MDEPTITITEEKRKNVFMTVFGTTTLPIKSFLPIIIKTQPDGVEKEAYFLDLDRITNSQKENLILHLASKSSQDYRQIEEEIARLGFPIISEGTIVEIPMNFFI